MILITSDEYIRNYIYSGAFSKIEDVDTLYVSTERLAHRTALEAKKNFLGYLEEPQWRRKACFDLMNIQMVRYRSRSPTFRFRLRRYSKQKQRKYWLLGLPVVERVATARIHRQLGIHTGLEKVLLDLQPHLIIVSSSVTSPLGIDAAGLGKRLGIKTLFLIDGWDNLSSKAVFPVVPDYLAVWGEQSVEHAMRIHRIPRERVLLIGTPRFDHYFRCNTDTLVSPYPFRYALFAGNALPFDEISALQILEHEIETMGISGFKIVYRPHPWRQRRRCFDRFEPEKYKHVIMDTPMWEPYLSFQEGKGIEQRKCLPSLDYYPALLHWAEFVISPLSTMMIESAILDTPALVIAYDDGCHLTSPHNAFRYYEHLRGIEQVNGFTLCHDKDTFGKILQAMYRDYVVHNTTVSLREQIRYFLYYDERSYPQRLKRVISDVMAQQ